MGYNRKILFLSRLFMYLFTYLIRLVSIIQLRKNNMAVSASVRDATSFKKCTKRRRKV